MSFRYDKLEILKEKGTILEIGCGNGYSQYHSKYKERFFDGKYLGIDINGSTLNSVVTDILKFETTDKFDIILAIEVFEHFDVRLWVKLLTKYLNFLKDEGRMVITVPLRQKRLNFWRWIDSDANYLKNFAEETFYNQHATFNISKKDFEYVLNHVNVKHRREYSKLFRIFFRSTNSLIPESFMRCLLRLIKRFFWPNSPYRAIGGLFQRQTSLVVTITKESNLL